MACYEERIRFNGQTNDIILLCAADRELEIRGILVMTHKVGFISAKGKRGTF